MSGVGATIPSAYATNDEGDVASYEALDTNAFPDGVTVSWVTDRFIQVRSEDAPVVGYRIETSAFVLERIQSSDEHGALRDQFSWGDMDYTGGDVFSELLAAVAWPLSESISDDFFDTHDLLWITGVSQDEYRDILENPAAAVSTDQEFYLLYGHTPFLFGVVPSNSSPEPGTVVDLSATVRHTGSDAGPLDNGDGGYLDIDSLESANDNLIPDNAEDTPRTPDPAWGQVQEAAFTGLQHHDQPHLSTALSNIEYADQEDLPRPLGGSLMMKEGQVRDAGSATGVVAEHALDSTGHQMVVGELLSSSWEDGDEPDHVNISIVIDTSGSMSERDTGWYHDDGTEKTRLEVAQESAHLFLDFITDGHTVSLVEFNTNASVVTDAVVLDDTTRAQLHNDIDGLADGGWTTIGGGLQTGAETIDDERGAQKLLLLSDGEENREPMVAEVLPDIRDRGVSVYTIGMGMDIDEDQLEFIAERTGAESLWDHDPGEVGEFFEEFGIDTQGRARLTETEAVVDEGDSVEDTCQVDSSCEDVQFALSYEGSEMSLVVTDPDGNRITERSDVTHREGAAHEVWTVDNPEVGEWSYSVEVEQVDAPQRARTQVSSDSQIDSELFFSEELYEQTGYLRLQYKVEEGLQRYTGADAYLEVDPPGEHTDIERLELYDDGGGADDVADDGIYSNYYHPTEVGEYEFTAVVEGGEFSNLQRESRYTTQVGSVIENPVRPFEEQESSFPVLPALLGLGGVTAAYVYFRKIRGGEEQAGGDRLDGPGASPGQPGQSSSRQADFDSPPDSSILSDGDRREKK